MTAPITEGAPRVLIAEDHDGFRAHARAFLECHRVTVMECANGREAVTLSHLEQPDWILMDIEMPIMDGLSATREILLQRPSARIVVLTSFDDDVHRQEALNAGACYFVPKEDFASIRETLGLNQTSL